MRAFAQAQAGTAHRGIPCVRCHGSSLAGYAAIRGREAGDMWPRFVLSLGSAEVTGAGDPLSSAGCLGCHSAISTGVVSAHGLRMKHETCVKQGQSCLECHGATAHGTASRAVRGPSMDECVTCHDGTTASAKCDLCHTAKLPSDRIAKGPWAVTHGANWQQTHGLGDLRTCRVCHASDYCRRCHGIDLPHPESFPLNHGQLALKSRAQCLQCHNEKTFCTSCHGIAMPHPAGFLPAHSKIARGFSDPTCAHCHPSGTCDACHTKHTHPGRTNGTLGALALPKVVR
jgi:hypothetical protein